MDLAVRLGDQMTRRLNECIRGTTKEEIALQHVVGLGQLLLRAFEIEVDV